MSIVNNTPTYTKAGRNNGPTKRPGSPWEEAHPTLKNHLFKIFLDLDSLDMAKKNGQESPGWISLLKFVIKSLPSKISQRLNFFW